MSLQLHVRPASVAGALGKMIALAACMGFVACASAPPKAGGAPQAPAASVAPQAPVSNPENLNRDFQHAQALYLSGHLKEASAAFEALTREFPRDANIWFRYGNTLTKLNDYEDAAAAYQNAIELDPTQGPAALNQALVRLAQAQGSLDVALARLPPGSPERAQADTLQTQIRTVVGGSPDRGASPR